MNRKEKRRFVRGLIRTVTTDILAQVPKMPAEWDGIELRRYIADRFELSVMGHEDDRGRWRKYRNTVLVNNL